MEHQNAVTTARRDLAPRPTYRRARVASGVSAARAAAEFGVSTNTLYAYERGAARPNALVVRKMALLYRVSADVLLGIAPWP